ncbi:hypothetical protein HKBW3S25_01044, partial [Candidatus Hakubella thermalkaliphila]
MLEKLEEIRNVEKEAEETIKRA